MSKEMREHIDTFKERLLKENKSTIKFEGKDEHTYKLYVDDVEVGSVYLDKANPTHKITTHNKVYKKVCY